MNGESAGWAADTGPAAVLLAAKAVRSLDHLETILGPLSTRDNDRGTTWRGTPKAVSTPAVACLALLGLEGWTVHVYPRTGSTVTVAIHRGASR